MPPSFKGSTIETVLREDRELWTRVANQVRSNLQPNKDDKLPIEDLSAFGINASVGLPERLQVDSRRDGSGDQALHADHRPRLQFGWTHPPFEV